MPRPSKRKLQVASRKRDENGSFSEFQEQRQGSIENDDDCQIILIKCCIVSFLLETLPRFTKLIGKINKSHVTHITQITMEMIAFTRYVSIFRRALYIIIKSIPTLKPFNSVQRHFYNKTTSNFVKHITTNIITGGFSKKTSLH